MVLFTRIVFWYLSRITEGPFDPEVIQSEYSIQDEEIKVMALQVSQEWSIILFLLHFLWLLHILGA